MTNNTSVKEMKALFKEFQKEVNRIKLLLKNIQSGIKKRLTEGQIDDIRTKLKGL